MKPAVLEFFIVINTAAFILNCMFAAVLFCNDHVGEGMIWAFLALCNGLAAQDAKKKKDSLPKL